MNYSDKKCIKGFYYDIVIENGIVSFSEYEDNPRGRNNGTSCDLKEFNEKSSEDALRVHCLIKELLGEKELEKLIQIVKNHFS